MTSPKRLDLTLVERGLAPAREKALALIMAGEVYVDGERVLKPDRKVARECEIVLEKPYPYVSRGGLKIEKAHEELGLELRGRRVLDIGISTGGFAHFILDQGAELVMGVDVNIKQVDQKIRQNERVILIKRNARYLKPDDLPVQPDLVTIDVSFISVLKILAALKFLTGVEVLALIKPQFEARRSEITSGGVIRDPDLRDRILQRLRFQIERLGYGIIAECEAGVKGRKGNQEYFFRLIAGNGDCNDDKMLDHD